MAWPLPPQLSAQRVDVAAGWSYSHWGRESAASANGIQQASCGPTVHPRSLPTRLSPRVLLLCFLSTYYVPVATDAEKAIHSFTHSPIHFFLLPFDK